VLILVCVALLAAAVALGGAARLAWFTAGVDAVGRGTVTVTATGADLAPGLSGVALLAVAAVAAAVSLAGVTRRILGGLVAVAGGWAAVTVAGTVLDPPTPAALAALPGAPAGGTPAAGSTALHAGPLPAAVGAALLLVAGVALVVSEQRLPRFGTRYAARDSTPPAGPTAAADPDRAAWDALDAGRDPTAGPAADLPGTTPPGRTGGDASGRAV
jgi:uncharacterized membrane protein (TIGR02234 family)